MSLHVDSEIQAFCLASRGCALGTDLLRSAKSWYVRVGSRGGLTSHRFLPPKYRLCSVGGGGARQTAQDHVTVRVVPRVPDCDVPEETAFRPQDVVRPGPLFTDL